MKNLQNSNELADTLILWIRDYAAVHIDSRLADQQGCFPPHVYLDLGNQGFFGMHASPEYGGSGLKTYDLLRVIEQVGAIDLTLTTLLIESIQGAHTLEKYASHNFKNHYLPQLTSGRIFVAGAMTETAAGSNPRVMQASAKSDNNHGWLLNGNKRWVGMGAWANLIAVYVQQYDAKDNWLGMSGFLIPQGTAGLRIGTLVQTMGIRAIQKHTIHFDNIKVTEEQLLGQAGQGMEIAQDNMMYIRLCLAAANVGAMKRSAQLLYRYAERRTIATGQLLENPVTLVCLSELTAAINATENLVYLLGGLLDKNPDVVPEEALVAVKIVASEFLGWTVDRLVQTLGARGYEEANGISQLFRDARAFRIFEGPTEALTMYIGSRMLTLNSRLQEFFCNILQQRQLFDEIVTLIEKLTQYNLLNKKDLFSKKFSIDYWSQVLIGDIVAHGLLLAAIQYQAQKNPSKETERTIQWTRSKFDEVVQKSLKFSPAERVLLQPNGLNHLISCYANKIGDTIQTPVIQSMAVDELLRPDSRQTMILNAENPQYKRQLQKYNIKNADYIDCCVHALFEKQAIATPDAIALVYGQETLSYYALNARANQLAHYLIKTGVATDTPVAICLDRSFDMIIAVLAVLKSGGSYVPFDQHYPEERLRFMIEDSGAQIILAQKDFSRRFLLENKTIILIDELREILEAESEKNPMLAQETESIAYLIYTSGSTGVPKGVMLPHRALTNLIQWQQEKIAEKRNILQFTTLSFDMSFLEIFSALSGGGTLILISEHDRLDLFNFARIIKTNAVEQLMLPVPFLRRLAESKIDSGYFLSLKEIITAGEQLTITPAITNFFDQLTQCRLLNYYGPSETHVVSAYQLPDKTVDWPVHIPIGRAIKNAKLTILNETLTPVQCGEEGELYLSGVSLARGYKNNSHLTQEKFIADPETQERLYRTGDFAKCLPDGNILYLGRKDQQVKISGYRIELQEIEIQFAKYPGIRNVAVIGKDDNFQGKRLEAFFEMEVAADKNHIEKIQLFLNKHLPPYMVPSIFHQLDKMPLTPSGKIDKIALGKIISSSPFATQKEQEQKTATEEKLISILDQFFNVPIDINHSFITIGGNSLLAMSIASLVHDKFHIELPPCTILSTPRIADIARQIDLLQS